MPDHRVRDAFRELRQRGYIARQGWMCCIDCAGARIAEDHEAIRRHGKRLTRGAVLFSREDQAQRQEEGCFPVMFAPFGADRCRRIPISKAMGEEVREVFDRHGLGVDWDGDIDEPIMVVERAQ